MMHHLRQVIAIGLPVLAGCSTHTQMPVPTQLSPVALREGSASITFNRLIIRIPSGTELGHHHDGLLKLQKFPYTWNANLTVASEEFKVLASEELRAYGYDVKGGDNLLFGADESGKAEYQLGGTLNEMNYDTFAPLAGNDSEARLRIEWQLYDTYVREVVFTHTTEGYSKLDGQDAGVIKDAFRSALRNLMANPMFVTTTERRPSEHWAAIPVGATPIALPECSAPSRLLPRDLENALDAVLLIQSGASSGSGVIVSPEGHALTAAHVVSGLEEVRVRLRSGLELSAAVRRVDEAQDVALIELPGRGHTCVPVAQGGPPPVGSDLFAVGAPLGEQLAHSVSRGIVSGRRQFDMFHYLQTDASLNPGNSGGPLFTTDGRVVGIVSWKIAASGFEGLAFGVPINALRTRLAISWGSGAVMPQAGPPVAAGVPQDPGRGEIANAVRELRAPAAAPGARYAPGAERAFLTGCRDGELQHPTALLYESPELRQETDRIGLEGSAWVCAGPPAILHEMRIMSDYVVYDVEMIETGVRGWIRGPFVGATISPADCLDRYSQRQDLLAKCVG